MCTATIWKLNSSHTMNPLMILWHPICCSSHNKTFSGLENRKRDHGTWKFIPPVKYMNDQSTCSKAASFLYQPAVLEACPSNKGFDKASHLFDSIHLVNRNEENSNLTKRKILPQWKMKLGKSCDKSNYSIFFLPTVL